MKEEERQAIRDLSVMRSLFDKGKKQILNKAKTQPSRKTAGS